MKLTPMNLVAAIFALLLIVFIIQNAINSRAYIWVFGAYASVQTGWLIFLSVLIGMGIGWALAKGGKPRR